MHGISLQHLNPGEDETEDELYYLTLTTIAGNDSFCTSGDAMCEVCTGHLC